MFVPNTRWKNHTHARCAIIGPQKNPRSNAIIKFIRAKNRSPANCANIGAMIAVDCAGILFCCNSFVLISSNYGEISYLHRHSRTKHSTVRAYACTKCEFATSHQSSLVRHEKTTHVTVKPFTCNMCNYATAERYCLNKHRKKHHNTQ